MRRQGQVHQHACAHTCSILLICVLCLAMVAEQSYSYLDLDGTWYWRKGSGKRKGPYTAVELFNIIQEIVACGLDDFSNTSVKHEACSSARSATSQVPSNFIVHVC